MLEGGIPLSVVANILGSSPATTAMMAKLVDETVITQHSVSTSEA